MYVFRSNKTPGWPAWPLATGNRSTTSANEADRNLFFFFLFSSLFFLLANSRFLPTWLRKKGVSRLSRELWSAAKMLWCLSSRVWRCGFKLGQGISVDINLIVIPTTTYRNMTNNWDINALVGFKTQTIPHSNNPPSWTGPGGRSRALSNAHPLRKRREDENSTRQKCVTHSPLFLFRPHHHIRF